MIIDYVDPPAAILENSNLLPLRCKLNTVSSLPYN